ncbi:MAG: site-specific integrase [Chloroflexi bacterium]|nr:site-specific integrase [Chloroflexota bacterium]
MKRRSRGEGSIYYLDKKKLWVAKITLPDGKRKVKYAKDQKAVRDWLAKTQIELRQGILVKDDNITFEKFVTDYMENVRKNSLRPKTFEVYSYLLKLHINPEIGHIKLVQLRPDHLQSLYAKKVTSGLSKRTVQFMHAIIHKALKQALKWGMVNRNVADLVEAPKPKRQSLTVWDSQQVNTFLSSCKDHRFFPIFVVAIYCGMREGELLGIHRENIDLSKGTIRVMHQAQSLKGGMVITDPKTESSKRLITVPKTALDVLKSHIKGLENKTGLIFSTSTGKPISPSNLQKAFREETEKAGLPRIRFHDLRHTSATLLLEAGVHPKVVQERLGHSQISMTLDLYSHVLPSMQKEAADKMEDILSIPKV